MHLIGKFLVVNFDKWNSQFVRFWGQTKIIILSSPYSSSWLLIAYIGYLGFLGIDLFKSVLKYSNGAICLI